LKVQVWDADPGYLNSQRDHTLNAIALAVAA
jgi:hypothetical protein